MPLLSSTIVTYLTKQTQQELADLLITYPGHPAILAAQKLLQALLENNDKLPKKLKLFLREVNTQMSIIDHNTNSMVPSVYDEATCQLGKVMLKVTEQMNESSLPLFEETPKGQILNTLLGPNKERFIHDLNAALKGKISLFNWIQLSAKTEKVVQKIGEKRAQWFIKIVDGVNAIPLKPVEDQQAFLAQLLLSYKTFLENALALVEKVSYKPVESAQSRLDQRNFDGMIAQLKTMPRAGGRSILTQLSTYEIALNRELKKVDQKPVYFFQKYLKAIIERQHETGSLLQQKQNEFEQLRLALLQAINKYCNDFSWQAATSGISEPEQSGGGGGGGEEPAPRSLKVKGRSQAKKDLLAKLETQIAQLGLENFQILKEQLETKSKEKGAYNAQPDFNRLIGFLVHEKDYLNLVSVQAYAMIALIQHTLTQHAKLVASKQNALWPKSRLSLGQTEQLLNHFLIQALGLLATTGMYDDLTLVTLIEEHVSSPPTLSAAETGGGGAAIDVDLEETEASHLSPLSNLNIPVRYKKESFDDLMKDLEDEISAQMHLLVPAKPRSRAQSGSTASLAGSATSAAAAAKKASEEASTQASTKDQGAPPPAP
jgi:hypothetical protein